MSHEHFLLEKNYHQYHVDDAKKADSDGDLENVREVPFPRLLLETLIVIVITNHLRKLLLLLVFLFLLVVI
jgi:hypothetical protein